MPACGKESVSSIWATTPRSPSPLGRRITHVKTTVKIEPSAPTPNNFSSLFDLTKILYHLLWSQLIAIPTLWFCGWLWLFSKALATLEIISFRRKRIVIVSGGSTVQALQLARHLHKKGVRVIVVELEGCFPLARFSNTVHRYYTLPRPNNRINDYIQALCDIVKREGATSYIPLSSTNEAIYDALAKPQLELLKCSVFCPRSLEVRQFDDFLEVLERCRHAGLPTPLYYPTTSLDDVYRLYDSGLLRSARHFIVAVGSSGVRKHARIPLPPFRQDFRLLHEISPQSPWVVVQELQGEQLVACCTLKDGDIVGSVTCLETSTGLKPVSKPEVLHWLEQAIRALRLRAVSGHLTLNIVVAGSGVIVPMGVQVGVPLAYICHTNFVPTLLSRPCGHVYVEPAGAVVHVKDVIFAWWDPLPYCAFYHLHLPAKLLRLEWLLGVRPL